MRMKAQTPNMWDPAIAGLGGKFTAINAHTKKEDLNK